MKRFAIITALLASTSAQAYHSGNEAISLVSGIMAQSVGASLVCKNVQMNSEFFKSLSVTLEMDEQDLDVAITLADVSRDDILSEVEKTGTDEWCRRTLKVLTKKTDGLAPVEVK